jgi:PAS domain S-box-containing protein
MDQAPPSDEPPPLRSLYGRIAALASAARDVNALLQSVHAAIGEQMPARNFYIALQDPQSGVISFPYFVDERDPAPEAKPPGRGLTEYVIRTRRPLLATPQVFDALIADGLVELIGTRPVDWLGVPLVTRERAVGVLVVQSYDPAQRYTGRERDILAFVSHLVALVIERRLAEDRLRNSEERFRALVELSGEGFILADARGGTTFATPALQRILGYTFEEIQGTSSFERMHPEDRERLQGIFGELMHRPGGSVAASYRHRHKDGTWRWLDGIATNLLHVPSVQAIAINYRDVTQHKEDAAALAASERRYRMLYERNLAGLVRTSADGRILDCNDAFARMLGFVSRGELMRHSAWEIYFDKDERRRFVEAILKEKVLTGYEQRLRRRDGMPVWVILNANLVEEFPYGQVLEGTIVDITERKAAEELHRQSRARLERALELGQLTEWEFDPESGRGRWSPGWHRMHGREHDGEPASLEEMMAAIHPEDREKVREAQARAAAALGRQQVEYRAMWPDGSLRHLEALLESRKDPAGRLRVVGTTRDLTERKAAEEALRRSERMSAMGSLVGAVAHEVRNPLFGISSTLDVMVARLGDRPEYQRYINVLREQVERMGALMRDLLEFGKPQQLELARGRLDHVLAAAAARCSPHARAHELAIHIESDSHGRELPMDTERLTLAFENLLMNALQHSPSGASVVMRILDEAERGFLDCAVLDSGGGFASEDVEHVFEPFFTRRRGGTGLGLSIVQRIVEAHGGRVWVGNRPEGGGRVTVRLPAPF